MTLPDLATLRRLHEQATNAFANFKAIDSQDTEDTQRWSVAFNANEDAQNAFSYALLGNLDALLHAASQWAQVQGMRERLLQHVERCTECCGVGSYPANLNASNMQPCHRCGLSAELLALLAAPPKE